MLCKLCGNHQRNLLKERIWNYLTHSVRSKAKTCRKPKQAYRTRVINRKLRNGIDIYFIIQITTLNIPALEILWACWNKEKDSTLLSIKFPHKDKNEKLKKKEWKDICHGRKYVS